RPPVPPASADQLRDAVDDVEELLADHPDRADWRRFLGLDQLDGASPGNGASRELAGEILDRWDQTLLTHAQQEYLQKEPFQQLHTVLASWDADGGAVARFCRALEHF